MREIWREATMFRRTPMLERQWIIIWKEYKEYNFGDDVSIDDIAALRFREHLFFVDGSGGKGKTLLYNTLIVYVFSRLDLGVMSMAWTGNAAHRTFGLSIYLTATSAVGWHVETPQSQAFRKVDLIFWEEPPMTHKYAVDRYMREVGNSADLHMGGKCCVFGSDFRQV